MNWKNVILEVLSPSVRSGHMVVLMVYMPFARLPLDLNACLFKRESFSIWREFCLS